MKWTNFTKAMQHAGFGIRPSGAGSNYLFRHETLRPAVNFHKPHSGDEIFPAKMKEWEKDLRDLYGWSMDSFVAKEN